MSKTSKRRSAQASKRAWSALFPFRRFDVSTLQRVLASMVVVAPIACGGGPNGPVRSRRTAADSADHVMFTVLTKLTNAGVKQADLEADTAYMYEASGRTELRRVTITFFSVAGVKQSVLTADSGTYMFR